MGDETSVVNWVPVIGTLAGASIGFLASFGTAYFIDKRKIKNETVARQRERLEELYKTLVAVKNDYNNYQFEIIKKVHHDLPFTPFEKKEELTPLVQLEMIVNLYFPELVNSHNKLEKSKNEFSKLLGKAITEDFSSYDLKQKQEFCGEVLVQYGVIDERIKSLQVKIAQIIKA